MNFQESLDYLLSLGFELSVKKFGLENTTILLEALGNPQNNFLKVQIAGTNGKGSTCAFLEAICNSAGIKVGLNTSPHLVSITERVRIDGKDISENEFARLATRVRGVSVDLVEAGKLQALPTYFEHVTAIAQLAFLENGVEVAILETGLGGRFDATTATNAEIVAITPIAMDHVKTLGPTIEDIASEKAAVIRHDTDVVIAEQMQSAMGVLTAKCLSEAVAPVKTESVQSIIENRRDTFGSLPFEPSGEEASFETASCSYPQTRLGLAGSHQIENAKTALLLSEILNKRGFVISPDQASGGLAMAYHRGRLELSDGILFDGAHNAAGAKVLREYLTERVPKPITMIYGSSSGKETGKIAASLFPMADQLILTASKNPRAAAASDFFGLAKKYVDKDSIHVIEKPADALELGRKLSGNGTLLVTGSLYLIGDIKVYLKQREVERRQKKNN